MFTLDHSLGFLVNRAALAMKRALEAGLAEYGLTAPQWAVMARLWQRDGRSQVELARGLFFDKPTVTGIIRRLEAKGLVARNRDPEDGRVMRVGLTPEGKALEEKLVPLAGEVNREATRGMDPEELAALKAGLDRVWENLKG